MPAAPLAVPPAAPVAAPPAVPDPGAIVGELCALCDQEPLLGDLGRLLHGRTALTDAIAVRGLNIVQDILTAAGTTGSSSRVRIAHVTLLKPVLQAVNSLDGPAGYRAAAWFHASCRDQDSAALHTALAEALLRCQPAAPTPDHVTTVMDALLDAKVLPKPRQWDGLFRLVASRSVVSQLDGTAVLELLTSVQLLLNKHNQGRMPQDAAHAMQPLFEAVVALLRAGRADTKQCVEVMGVCADMLVVPEALVAKLNKLRWDQIEPMTWQQAFTLLRALAHLGFGVHSPHDQRHIAQPMGLLKDLLQHCLDMSRKKMPSRHMARGLVRICAYLNLNNSTTAKLIDALSLHGFDLSASDPCLHQLYQGQVWLKAHGWERTRGLDFATLQRVRERVIEGGHTSGCNKVMCQQLLVLKRMYPGLIKSVSYCDYVKSADQRQALLLEKLRPYL